MSGPGEIEEIERDGDIIVDDYLQAQIKGKIDADDVMQLNMMIAHMERVIERCRNTVKPAAA